MFLRAKRVPVQGKHKLRQGCTTLSPWAPGTPWSLLLTLLVPLLDLSLAEGGKAGEAILLVVMHHVLRDLLNGRKGSWEGNRGRWLGALAWP